MDCNKWNNILTYSAPWFETKKLMGEIWLYKKMNKACIGNTGYGTVHYRQNCRPHLLFTFNITLLIPTQVTDGGLNS